MATTFKCSMQKKKESLAKKAEALNEALAPEELKKVEADLLAQLKEKCKKRPAQKVYSPKDFLSNWGLSTDDKLATSTLFEADYYTSEDADYPTVVKGYVFYEYYKDMLYATRLGKESEESLLTTCINTLKTMLDAGTVTVFDNNL